MFDCGHFDGAAKLAENNQEIKNYVVIKFNDGILPVESMRKGELSTVDSGHTVSSKEKPRLKRMNHWLQMKIVCPLGCCYARGRTNPSGTGK